VSSCGKVKTTLIPLYYFEIGKSYIYKASLKMDLTIDAGLIKYSGPIELSADIELKAAETNEMGYRLIMDIKNIEIKGAENPVSGTINLGINSIKNSLSSFYLNEKGRPTVLYNGKPVVGLNSYVQIFFPDLSELEVKKELLYLTNFPASFQKQDYVVVFKKFSKVLDSEPDNLLFQNQIEFFSYPKEDFLSRDDKNPNGSLTLSYQDIFSFMHHQLISKKGNINMNFSFSIREGFLTYVISFQGNGDFEIILQEKVI